MLTVFRCCFPAGHDVRAGERGGGSAECHWLAAVSPNQLEAICEFSVTAAFSADLPTTRSAPAEQHHVLDHNPHTRNFDGQDLSQTDTHTRTLEEQQQ